MNERLHILVAVSELEPYASEGQLGSFVRHLSAAMADLDLNVTIVMPDYRSVSQDFNAEPIFPDLAIPISDRTEPSSVFQITLRENLDIYFINNSRYFNREGVYKNEDGEFADNAERYIYYCRGVMEIINLMPRKPDIVHCHDWQSALIPLYIHRIRKSRKSHWGIRTVFTIHNLAYQGLFWRFDMHLTGLPWDYFTPSGIEFYGDLNFLKAGIIFSDALTTVSAQYARDIQTAEHGCGLDGLIKEHRKKLTGINSGIDYTEWNPEIDSKIPNQFSPTNMAGKSICKQHLQKKLHLVSAPDIPIAFFISELIPQKGADLFESVLPGLMKRPIQIVVAGTGHEHYIRQCIQLAVKFPGKFAFIEKPDKFLIHEIVAGSDLHLVPSRYEPCGVEQLFSLGYGVVPIVKTVGGLLDIIRSFYENGSGGYSFTFDDYSTYDFLDCIDRGIRTYHKTEIWQELIATAMHQRFTWSDTANEYLTLFQRLAQTNG